MIRSVIGTTTMSLVSYPEHVFILSAPYERVPGRQMDVCAYNLLGLLNVASNIPSGDVDSKHTR